MAAESYQQSADPPIPDLRAFLLWSHEDICNLTPARLARQVKQIVQLETSELLIKTPATSRDSVNEILAVSNKNPARRI